LYVHLTVTTVDAALARILEPRAPRPDLRLQAVTQLVQSGIPAGVIIAPVMPGITDAPQALEAVVCAAAAAGGMHVFANPLFLKPCSASVFLPFLEAEFPHLVSDYRERYEGRAFVSADYRKQIAALLTRLQQKYGFPMNHSKTGRGRDPIAARKYPLELAHEQNANCGATGRKKESQAARESLLLETQLKLF
jgi:DNA repair photolyase